MIEASSGPALIARLERVPFSRWHLRARVIMGSATFFDAFDARQELTTQGILASVEETVTLAQTMEEEINALREWATARARLASAPLAREQGADVRRLEV